MKEEQDYIRDIAEMRTLMERSSRFLSLSGLAGILAGIYALAGAWIAYRIFDFNPGQMTADDIASVNLTSHFLPVVLLALLILTMAIGTAIFLSYKKAAIRREKFWNPVARRLLINMAVPLVTGGLLILMLISKGLIGLVAPFTLIFYGLALFNASKLTYEEVRSLGLMEIGLGLISSYYVECSLLCWALGFGVLHIVYGIYMHYRYEK
jgi:hypothetical protein